MEIRKIDALATYPIRQLVLRQGKPLESCCFEGDNLDNTFHFGLFVKDLIVGIISLFNCKNSNFKSENQIQIRGMAVLEDFQKQGLGALLVKHAEKLAIENNYDIIWFNAREKAVPFYNKLQYQSIGDAFEIQDIGPHYIMFKKM